MSGNRLVWTCSVLLSLTLIPSAGLAKRSKKRAGCVRPQAYWARVMGKLDPKYDRFSKHWRDINRDGKPDLFLTTNGYCGSGGCLYLIFTRQRGCFRWVGKLAARDRVTVHRRRQHGFFDLSGGSYAGSCHGVYSRLRYNGWRYRVVATRTCRCRPITTKLKRGIATLPFCGKWRWLKRKSG